jgi:hypothetical protein
VTAEPFRPPPAGFWFGVGFFVRSVSREFGRLSVFQLAVLVRFGTVWSLFGYLGLFQLVLGQIRERLVSIGSVKGLETERLVQSLGARDAGHPHLDDELLDGDRFIHEQNRRRLRRKNQGLRTFGRPQSLLQYLRNRASEYHNPGR